MTSALDYFSTCQIGKNRSISLPRTPFAIIVVRLLFAHGKMAPRKFSRVQLCSSVDGYSTFTPHRSQTFIKHPRIIRAYSVLLTGGSTNLNKLGLG
jgi:hypothetical protein